MSHSLRGDEAIYPEATHDLRHLLPPPKSDRSLVPG